MAQLIRIRWNNFLFVEDDGDLIEGCIEIDEHGTKTIGVRRRGEEKFVGRFLKYQKISDKEWIEKFVSGWDGEEVDIEVNEDDIW